MRGRPPREPDTLVDMLADVARGDSYRSVGKKHGMQASLCRYHWLRLATKEEKAKRDEIVGDYDKQHPTDEEGVRWRTIVIRLEKMYGDALALGNDESTEYHELTQELENLWNDRYETES